jgi:hypothetical protein
MDEALLAQENSNPTNHQSRQFGQVRINTSEPKRHPDPRDHGIWAVFSAAVRRMDVGDFHTPQTVGVGYRLLVDPEIAARAGSVEELARLDDPVVAAGALYGAKTVSG